jgi:hypothetical protein
MNIIRFETETHKDAEKLHKHAQQTGDAAAYRRAAQLYERAGDYGKARVCYDAADALENVQ